MTTGGNSSRNDPRRALGALPAGLDMALDVSRLLDGQLDDASVKPVLDKVAADPRLRDRYTMYSLVGDALRSNSTPDDGFTLRILAWLEAERGLERSDARSAMKDDIWRRSRTSCARR